MTTRNIGAGALFVTSGDASRTTPGRETVEPQWYASADCISAHWCECLMVFSVHRKTSSMFSAPLW